MLLDAIRRLFAPSPPPPRVPRGRRVYAVGDIHGRLDLLDRLLAMIEADAAGEPCEVILLGDYVDRGPSSAEVLDRLLDLPGWAKWTMLMGNHEQAMLDAIGDGPMAERAMRQWLKFGGRDTLRSYGVSMPIAYGEDSDAIRAAIRPLLPPAHLQLLQGLSLARRIGDYLFVHAGVRPGIAIEDQEPMDLMWIREEFLDNRGWHGAVIVHGHSITRKVVSRHNRIGIDTGAYSSGKLTALALDGTNRRFLATG